MIKLSQGSISGYAQLMTRSAAARDSYHHGNLPETLIREGARLLAERGIESFSTREVARRTGVSVAAPSHHFGSSKGLLTAIATQGFEILGKEMARATDAAGGAENAISAMCRAYIDVGAQYPGHATVMFRLDLLDDADASFRDCSFRAFGLLREAVKRAVGDHAADMDISNATKTLWATMHGVMTLTMIKQGEAIELVEFTTRTLLAGMREAY